MSQKAIIEQWQLQRWNMLVFRIFGASPIRNRFAIGGSMKQRWIFMAIWKFILLHLWAANMVCFARAMCRNFFRCTCCPEGVAAKFVVYQSFPCLFLQENPTCPCGSMQKPAKSCGHQQKAHSFPGFTLSQMPARMRDAKRLPLWPKRVLSACFGLEAEMLLRGFWGK